MPYTIINFQSTRSQKASSYQLSIVTCEWFLKGQGVQNGNYQKGSKKSTLWQAM
jgi:hypothetical protein